MIETRSQSVGVQPEIVRLPSPTTTIGAIASIGIVCEATTYGIRPRWRIWKRAITAPSRKPTVAPIAKPTAASLAMNSAASSRRSMSKGPPSRVGSKSAPTMSCRCGSVVESTTKGRVQPVSIQIQR